MYLNICSLHQWTAAVFISFFVLQIFSIYLVSTTLSAPALLAVVWVVSHALIVMLAFTVVSPT